MSPERYQSKSKTIFDKLDIDWPAVLDPDGWDGVMHKFNFTWFGLVVVDTEGVVRGIGVHGEQLSKLMQQIYPDHQ